MLLSFQVQAALVKERAQSLQKQEERIGALMAQLQLEKAREVRMRISYYSQQCRCLEIGKAICDYVVVLGEVDCMIIFCGIKLTTSGRSRRGV